MKIKSAALKRVAAIGGIATIAMGATPAFAEGGFNSSISYWATGAESRRWHDAAKDSASTTVRLSGCTTPTNPGKSASATVAVYKDISFQPDRSYGSKSVCGRTGYWGNPGSGTFYFSLSTINGTSGPGTFHLDAKGVKVGY
ncbi:hypothetical protein [Streptomyces chattanoogensis]|uniref:hypothetical protein n=1 Tax=Streptomyces chattanoogensis TaxID=66876 RepID=UPI003684A118